MADVPFMKGTQSLCTFYIGSTKREILTKTWSVARAGTKINDGVNGEDRDRLDFEVTHFDVALELFTKDVKMIKALVEDQAVDDSGVQPTEKAFAIGLKPRDGTKSAFSLSEGCVDDWKLASGGRTERIMTTLPLRFRYMKSVPL